MTNKRLKNRQRTRMSARMKWIIGASVFGLAAILLIIYFNFFEVPDSRAFSSGDYRSVESGEWNDAQVWEVFDGTDWSPASMPPGSAASKVQITSGHQLTITDEIPVCQLVIDSGATVTLESNTVRVSKNNGKGGIICNGTLIMNTCILEGNGDFTAGHDAELRIGSDQGFSKRAGTGNIQLSGKRDLNKETRFIFNGSIRQHMGNGLPSQVTELVVNNNSGVDLDQPLQVIGSLTLKLGVLYTGKHQLVLGNSSTEVAKLIVGKGSVCGKWNTWFGDANAESLVFPLSDGNQVCAIAFHPTISAFRKGLIELTYREGMPDDDHLSPFEARRVVVGMTPRGHFGAMLSNGPEEAWLMLKTNPDPGVTTWEIAERNADAVKSSARLTERSFQNLICGPDPFSESLFVRFYCGDKTFALLQLNDPSGKILQKEKVQAEPGYNQFALDIDPSTPDGNYILQVSNLTDIHTCRVTRKASTELTQSR